LKNKTSVSQSALKHNALQPASQKQVLQVSLNKRQHLMRGFQGCG